MATNAKRVGRAKDAVSYDRDYYGWIQHNVSAIREGRFKDVDWPTVAEELEDMGKSERRALRSQLARLLAHLLKWSYQPEARQLREHSWRAAIENARNSVRELVEESPTFRPQLAELFSSAYFGGVAQAAAQTNAPMETFPVVCPWSLDQAMDEDFWPE